MGEITLARSRHECVESARVCGCDRVSVQDTSGKKLDYCINLLQLLLIVISLFGI